jgi:RNA recognition motif-containing protein
MRILSGKELHGRQLKVKPRVQKCTGGPRSHSDRLDSTRWRDGPRLNSQWRRQDPPVAAPCADLLIPVQQQRRLFIGGLPRPTDSHASDLEIREVFKDFTVEAMSKVKSMTAEEAQRAIRQLHGVKMWGGNITVNLAKRNPGKVPEAIAREREQERERTGTYA